MTPRAPRTLSGKGVFQMPEIFFRVLRLLIRTTATGAGGIGIYALVCSALYSRPDAALLAIVALSSAIGITLGLPPKKRP